MTNNKLKKAVFPVGGLGTRFLPATKALPKEMLPVASKPLIQHAFEEARAAGIEEFLFITGRNKNIITNHFDCVYELERELDAKDKHDALSQTRDWVPDAGKIAFIRQQHPLGLGHAVWCARHFIQDEPFAVLLADELFISNDGVPLLAGMAKEFAETRSNMVAISEIDMKDSYKYGMVKPKSDFNGRILDIESMVEKPKPENSPSNYSIVGRYILQPEIFKHLEAVQKDGSGEIQLTNAINNMIADTKTTGYRFDGKRFDCGNQLGFLEANIEFAMQDDAMGGKTKELVKKIAQGI